MENKEDLLEDIYKNLNHQQFETVMAMLQDASKSDLLTTTKTCLLVTHGLNEMCIALNQVYEILRLKDYKINDIPCENKKVRGMINVRGDIIPLIHLIWCRNGANVHQTCQYDEPLCRYIVLIESKAFVYGLMVHDIIGIRAITDEMTCVDVDRLY